MKKNRILLPFTLAALCLLSSGSMAGPSAEAQALISELQLRSDGNPLSENPAWNPKRVMVTLPPFYSSTLPGLEQKFRDAAGDVEIVFDRSANFVPDPENLAGVDAVISLCLPQIVDGAGDNLLWLHNYLAGMDTCKDLTAEQIETTVFTNSKRLAGQTIAEHSTGMMLSLARGLPTFHTAQTESLWNQQAATSIRFGDLKGKTILVVGLGGIGSQIAERAHALGMRVIATRNSSRNGPDYVDYVGLPDELLKLAGEADVIVNALPLTSKTSGLFDASFFDSARRGAIFISVGRGKSTVTDDLITALQSGQLYAAGLDVTDPEPLPKGSPLWQMKNVLITPHVSSVSPDSANRTTLIAVENLRRYVAGEALLNLVNMEAGY